MGNEQSVQINQDEFKTKLIAIPNRTYLVDTTKTKEILSRITNCKREHIGETNLNKYIINLTETVSFIFDHITHISFINFVQKLIESIRKFETKIGSKEFVLYIPHPAKHDKKIHEKSNYWVSQMVYQILRRKPKNVYSILPDVFYNPKLRLRKQILLCDDGSFSGTQMCSQVLDSSFFGRKNEQTGEYDRSKFDLHFVIPFMTQKSKKRIQDSIPEGNSCNFNDSFEIVIPEIPHILADKAKSLLYFDHRIPDFFSTYSTFFNRGTSGFGIDEDMSCLSYKTINAEGESHKEISIIKKCKIDNESECKECEANGGESCPIIPYRDEHLENKELVQLLTPDEFLTKFIPKDGQKKRKSRKRSKQQKSKRSNKRKSKKRKSTI